MIENMIKGKSEEELKNFYLNNSYTVDNKDLETMLEIVELESDKVTKKIGKKKFTYYNIPVAFDIETTSYVTEDFKTSFMYIWMFMIDGVMIYGRTWQEYRDLLDMLSKIFKLNDELRLAVYIHNEAFEFQHMRKELFGKWEVFCRKEREPMYARIGGFEFRDSLILAGVALDKIILNKYKNLHKLTGDLDYDLIRTKDTVLTDEEFLYCVWDVLVLSAFIKEKIEDDGSIVKIPMTKTGYVRKFLKEKTIFGPNRLAYKRKVQDDLTMSEAEYDVLRKCFMGGFTHSNPENTDKTIKNVRHIDFTSSYPTVMIAEKFPITTGRKIFPKNGEYFELEQLEKLASDHDLLWCGKVSIDGLCSTFDGDYYISNDKCIAKKNAVNVNGRIQSADHVEIYLTDVDIKTVKESYTWDPDSMKISEVYIYRAGYLPKEIIECLLDLYEKKTTLKNIKGREIEYLLSKELLNSIYGVTVQKILNDIVTYEDHEWEHHAPDTLEEITKYNEKKSRFNIYSWGVWVTAYARRNLWKGILACGEENYIYSDTDSIFYRSTAEFEEWIKEYNKEIISKLRNTLKELKITKYKIDPKNSDGIPCPLGVWDREKDCDAFKTLGAKRYIEKRNGEYYITVAGLSKKKGKEYISKQDNPLEFFSNEMKIPAEHTGKLTHIYCDDEHEIAVKDYQGHYTKVITKSGICLTKAPFKMTMTEDFVSFIMESKKETIEK